MTKYHPYLVEIIYEDGERSFIPLCSLCACVNPGSFFTRYRVYALARSGRSYFGLVARSAEVF